MDMTSRLLIALGMVGCVDAPPHAVVHARAGMASLGGPVLVLPTRCITALDAMYCVPMAAPGVRAPVPASYAELIDPSLRLKLEFAGYTLAEAAVMTVTTRDRIETQTSTTHDDALPIKTTTSEVTPALSLAELAEPEVVAVARSLRLAGIITSVLDVASAPHGTARYTLTVTLRELDRLDPVWSVTCSEIFLGNEATSKLLGNCVGNGVLAVYAPDNLLGRPL